MGVKWLVEMGICIAQGDLVPSRDAHLPYQFGVKMVMVHGLQPSFFLRLHSRLRGGAKNFHQKGTGVRSLLS